MHKQIYGDMTAVRSFVVPKGEGWPEDVGGGARTYGECYTAIELLRRRQSRAQAIAGRRGLCLGIEGGHQATTERAREAAVRSALWAEGGWC
jgi:hypothetical protein